MTDSEKSPQATEAEKRAERKQIIARNLERLQTERREGKIDGDDMDNNGIYYICGKQGDDRPLDGKDLINHDSKGKKKRPIVISQDELETLESFGASLRFLDKEGNEIVIDAENTGYDPDDILVIFPDEVGDTKN